LHAAVFGRWSHVSMPQTSSVHGLKSSKHGSPIWRWPKQKPSLHASFFVQGLRSSHDPIRALPKQTPIAQVSLVVHGLKSSQGSLLFVAMQSPTWLQASVVQSLKSALQGVPISAKPLPTHVASALQWSPSVHSLSSSHGVPICSGTWLHVPSPLQTSFVQLMKSVVQDDPDASNWQVDEQQSPSTTLASSHSSPGSSWSLPHSGSKSLPSSPWSFRTVKLGAKPKRASCPAWTTSPFASKRTTVARVSASSLRMPLPHWSAPSATDTERDEKLAGPTSCAAVPTLTTCAPSVATPYAAAGCGTEGSESVQRIEPFVSAKRAVVNRRLSPVSSSPAATTSPPPRRDGINAIARPNPLPSSVVTPVGHTGSPVSVSIFATANEPPSCPVT
jgi:hypothetical protein